MPAAGVEGSAFTVPLLRGRSSEVVRAPVNVLTEWLRVVRESSAVDEAVENGLRSRLALPRSLPDTCNDSVASDRSVNAPAFVLPDLVPRVARSSRFSTGLRGSTSGDGIGVPVLKGVGRRSFFHKGARALCCRGGVARAAIIPETRASAGCATRETVEGAVAGCCGWVYEVRP